MAMSLEDFSAARPRGAGKSALGHLRNVLENKGLDLDDLGSVRMVWAKTRVDGEGEEVYAGSSVLLAPSWETGPEWQAVDRGPVPKVVVPKSKASALGGRWKTALILPDPQIGYRRLTDGSLDPFHDPRAIDLALQIAEAERPDLTVWLGDFLDLAPMGRFRYEPGFALTVQPAVDRGTEIQAGFAELSKETRLIEGNHDKRLATYVTDNAAAAYGLRRGGTPPDTWPVLSVPYLLRLDDLNVQYVGGYPNGASYVNDSLACIHGSLTGNKVRSAASLVVEDERVSVIFGHVHRIEARYKTRNSRGAPKFSAAFSPGCLARIDGAVPSTKSSLDPAGRPSKHFEDWQQGVMVVRYTDDGLFAPEMVPIFEGRAIHRSQEFVSQLDVHDR